MSAIGRPARRVAIAAAVGLGALVPSASAATGETYRGETEDGRAVKLFADVRGVVDRGGVTVATECTGGFDPFRSRIRFDGPLDRSGPSGFRDKSSYVDEDDRFSARYRYVIEAERESKRVIVGEISATITFRREGTEYTTCTVEDLVFDAVREDEARG